MKWLVPTLLIAGGAIVVLWAYGSSTAEFEDVQHDTLMREFSERAAECPDRECVRELRDLYGVR